MINNKITTILFDFDGTLADTLPLIFRIGNEMFVKAGRPAIPLKDLEIWRNKGGRKFYADLGIPLLLAPYYLRRMQREMNSEMASVPTFSGLEQILHDLHGKGYQLGLVSTNTEKNIRAFFRAHTFPKFDFYYFKSGIFSKAARLKRLLKRHDIRPEQTIYVADETRDIESAHIVGIPIIAVSWGYNNQAALQELSPEYLVSTANELRSLLLGD